MTLVTQDARPGRTFATAFECYGNPPVGGAPGTFTASYAFPYVGGTCGGEDSGVTDGNTLAQTLTNVDLMVVYLGTNDELGVPLGQMGDSVSAGTFYGNLRWVVETYLRAKPTMRLVLVSAGFINTIPVSQTQQYVSATTTYGNSMGIPVVNMLALAGVNSITYPVLLRDGVHPSDFGFAHNVGPVIAQALQQLF